MLISYETVKVRVKSSTITFKSNKIQLDLESQLSFIDFFLKVHIISWKSVSKLALKNSRACYFIDPGKIYNNNRYMY